MVHTHSVRWMNGEIFTNSSTYSTKTSDLRRSLVVALARRLLGAPDFLPFQPRNPIGLCKILLAILRSRAECRSRSVLQYGGHLHHRLEEWILIGGFWFDCPKNPWVVDSTSIRDSCVFLALYWGFQLILTFFSSHYIVDLSLILTLLDCFREMDHHRSSSPPHHHDHESPFDNPLLVCCFLHAFWWAPLRGESGVAYLWHDTPF